MDAQRIGRIVRAARQRKSWRQSDLAATAAVSRSLVSLVERGFADHVPLYRLRLIAKCLDLEVFGYEIRSRTGVVDTLLDEGHARLVGGTVELLRGLGWEVWAELSYSWYGERGSFDLLGWLPRTSSLLVIEVKTELVSVEATIRKLDEKQRLAPIVARDRLGLVPRAVSVLLVMPRSSTSHRQVARHGAVIDLALPGRSVAARAWLRRPTGRFAGVLFASDSNVARARRSRRARIRCERPRSPRIQRGRGPNPRQELRVGGSAASNENVAGI